MKMCLGGEKYFIFSFMNLMKFSTFIAKKKREENKQYFAKKGDFCHGLKKNYQSARKKVKNYQFFFGKSLVLM